MNMLPYPPRSYPQQQQQYQDNQHYLSLQNNQGYVTSSPQSTQPNPRILDDLTFLDATDSLSSSLPLNDHGGWFPFSSQPFDGLTGMNFDDSFFGQATMMPTINETTVSPSMPPPPQLLTQSFTPESTLLSPEYQQLQLPQQFQQQHSDKIDSNNRLQPPSYKGHRRRRSSSVPSLFHSVKKRIIQSSIVVPSAGGSNTNSYPQEPTYSAAQQQPAPINTGVPIHPLYYAPPQHTKPLPIQIQRNPAFHRRSASPTTLNQDQLDEKLLQVNFNDVTVAELKDHLRERNLSVAGRKAELTQRLYNERQQVHARRQQGKIDPQDIPTIASPVSLSNSPPSSVFSSSSLAEAPSPRPIQQLTHQLHDLDIQHSFSDYYHQPSLDTTPPSFKSPLSNHPVVQHQHWDGDNSMPLFYQF